MWCGSRSSTWIRDSAVRRPPSFQSVQLPRTCCCFVSWRSDADPVSVHLCQQRSKCPACHVKKLRWEGGGGGGGRERAEGSGAEGEAVCGGRGGETGNESRSGFSTRLTERPPRYGPGAWRWVVHVHCEVYSPCFSYNPRLGRARRRIVLDFPALDQVTLCAPFLYRSSFARHS